jgi:alkylation response protein AidB-like acyl-CoA dehydrogenase
MGLAALDVHDRTHPNEEGFAMACESASRWPLPGEGSTFRRFALLAEGCRRDAALGRLAEAHGDAVAILAEIGTSEGKGSEPVAGRRWAVWAAGPPESLVGTKTGDGWRLTGWKRWCSGATLVTHALVVAATESGQRLFAVDVSQSGVVVERSGWVGPGMAGADTRTVDFVDACGIPIGEPGCYLARPGFWAGAVGVAACWHGVSVAVGETLRAASAETSDPHQLAYLGRVYVALKENSSLLRWAASRFDDDRTLPQPIVARTTRSAIASNAGVIIDAVGRALGPAPMAFDRRHIQAVLDLQVYVRQEHAERDLTQLGADLREQAAPWTF